MSPIAENPTVDNGTGTDYIVSTDEDGDGAQIQRVKLAYAADGSKVHVPADADGLLVNLGVNNDVTVTGTVAVTDNAGSLTVDGEVAATQSGTWTVQPGNTANTTAWKVDGSAVTQPVSAASLPLPSGASTAAKQPALGTAGLPSADVISVQGVTSMTALKIDGSGVTQPVSDGGGSLTVDGTVAVSGTVAVTQSGTWDEVGINDSGNSITVDAPVGTPAFVRLSDGAAAITTLPVSVASVPSHAVTNAGTFAVQVDGAALTALQLIDDPVQVLGTDTYTEAASKGLTVGAVRRDADTTLVNTTNEFGPLQMDANGRLKVEAFSGETLPVSLTSTTVTGTVAVTDNAGSLTVDNGGTFVVQENGAALTALQLIDDIVYTDDTSTHATGTSKGALIMGAATPTDTAVNANDIGAVGMTNNRELYVSLRDIAGTAPVSGSGTATGALRVELANNGTGLVGLNAGSNAIGKLAANSGVDIGDVDITSVISGTGATNLGKAIDTAVGATDTGVGMLSVRRDLPTALTPAAGDWAATTVSSMGQQWVLAGTRKRLQVNSASLTTASTAYTAGDVLGAQFDFASFALATGGGGWIESIVLHDYADITGTISVFLYRDDPANLTDNAAFSLADADNLLLICAPISIGMLDSGANRVGSATGLSIPYTLAATTLYAQLRTDTAHTFFGAATDIKLDIVATLDS